MSNPSLTTSYWPADCSSPLLWSTVGGVLRAAAEQAPDQVALVSGDPDPARRRQWSYSELLTDAERAARALCAGFWPGEPVAVWADNCPEWVVLEFAAALAGLTLVTVNPAYQAEELVHVLRHSRARGLFLAAEHRGAALPPILDAVRGQLPDLREVIPLDDLDQFCASGGRQALPQVCPASAAQVLYTSGTTGTAAGGGFASTVAVGGVVAAYAGGGGGGGVNDTGGEPGTAVVTAPATGLEDPLPASGSPAGAGGGPPGYAGSGGAGASLGSMGQAGQNGYVLITPLT